MAITFKKATKKQRKLRAALIGPSGSGKTWTALELATGLAEGGMIALIDTERGSASLYSDRFDFESTELRHYDPAKYMEAIKAAADAGATVLVIDSLSHAWSGEGGILSQVDKQRGSGNDFTVWAKMTPIQNKLVGAILDFPGHVIVTLRVKTEYVLEKNEKGKTVPRRVGLKPVQRDELEYEFDIMANLDRANTLTIEKTRMASLTEAVIEKPDRTLSAKILDWLNDGEAPPVFDRQGAITEIVGLLEKMNKPALKVTDAKNRLESKSDSEVADAVEEARGMYAEFLHKQAVEPNREVS